MRYKKISSFCIAIMTFCMHAVLACAADAVKINAFYDSNLRLENVEISHFDAAQTITFLGADVSGSKTLAWYDLTAIRPVGRVFAKSGQRFLIGDDRRLQNTEEKDIFVVETAENETVELFVETSEPIYAAQFRMIFNPQEIEVIEIENTVFESDEVEKTYDDGTAYTTGYAAVKEDEDEIRVLATKKQKEQSMQGKLFKFTFRAKKTGYTAVALTDCDSWVIKENGPERAGTEITVR